jgi:hypothetical protein
MQQFSSTQAKQNFGQLLKSAALAPVAIERHGKVQALVGAPEFFLSPSTTPTSASREEATARRLARLGQLVIEKDRLIRHQRIALDLVTLPAPARRAMIERALVVVERWRKEQLCSRDYIDRWAAILRLPPQEMASAMASDADGWGTALRQNSPWVGVHA